MQLTGFDIARRITSGRRTRPGVRPAAAAGRISDFALSDAPADVAAEHGFAAGEFTVSVSGPNEPGKSAPEQRDTKAMRNCAATRFAALGVVLVLAVHVWIISAGQGDRWPEYSTHYSRLADAFRHVRTSLKLAPAIPHMALADPHDPDQNRAFRLREGVHDSLLYRGKFYTFWGPVPALLLVTVGSVTGLWHVGDQYLVFFFMAGTVLFTALLARRIWGRFFVDQPPWTLFLAVIVAGLTTPMAYLLARAAVYEAAILGGQFFLLAGLYFLCAPAKTTAPRKQAVAGDTEKPASPAVDTDDPLIAALMSGQVLRPRRLRGKATRVQPPADVPSDKVVPLLPGHARLALVGTCWAMAVGSRVSLAIAVTALGLLVVWRIIRDARDRGGAWTKWLRPALTRMLAFGLPLVAAAVALGAYNHARFGDWREFGQKYQLTGANYRTTPALFSPSNAPPGLYSYALRPLYVCRDFPYLFARGGAGTFPSFIHIPAHYEFTEPIAGLMVVTPFLWLAAFPALSLVRGIIRPRIPRDRELIRVIACLFCASILGFAPVVFMLGSTMRYLADLTPCLMLLAMIGIWQRGRGLASSPRVRGTFLAFVGLLAVYSVIVGQLLSITGYYNHFSRFNHKLFTRLSYRTQARTADDSR